MCLCLCTCVCVSMEVYGTVNQLVWKCENITVYFRSFWWLDLMMWNRSLAKVQIWFRLLWHVMNANLFQQLFFPRDEPAIPSHKSYFFGDPSEAHVASSKGWTHNNPHLISPMKAYHGKNDVEGLRTATPGSHSICLWNCGAFRWTSMMHRQSVRNSPAGNIGKCTLLFSVFGTKMRSI